MEALWIACRKCAAQPNDQCFDGWKFDNQTQTEVKNYRSGFHEERLFDAATWDSAATPVDKELIRKAAEDLV